MFSESASGLAGRQATALLKIYQRVRSLSEETQKSSTTLALAILPKLSFGLVICIAEGSVRSSTLQLQFLAGIYWPAFFSCRQGKLGFTERIC
jgi:hypothetical protein